MTPNYAQTDVTIVEIINVLYAQCVAEIGRPNNMPTELLIWILFRQTITMYLNCIRNYSNLSVWYLISLKMLGSKFSQ